MSIEFETTNKDLLIIKQSSPKIGSIVIHLSELDAFIGMMEAFVLRSHEKEQKRKAKSQGHP
jgi:hypothetical protein